MTADMAQANGTDEKSTRWQVSGVCERASGWHKEREEDGPRHPGALDQARTMRRCLIRDASAANGPSPRLYVSTMGCIAAGNSPIDER